MKAELLKEPELEFGGSFQHIDIRFGIMNYGPFDLNSPLAPKQIKIGIVGTEKTVERFLSWLELCEGGLDAKTGNKPNLFPQFPGLGREVGLRTSIITSKELTRTVHRKSILEATKLDHNNAVRKAVELFLEQLQYVSKSKNIGPDVLVCLPPIELFRYFDKPVEEDEEEDDSHPDTDSEGYRLDFHDMLKSKSLNLPMPVQFVRPSTYDPSATETRKKGTLRQLQDPATRAWNFFTALYYKAGGTPWRLVRDPAEYTTCFVGISFYRSLDLSSTSTSVAQVFNERGQGVILRGGPAEYLKDDKQPHLSGEAAYTLLKNALEAYRSEHETLPARVVVHKSSIFTEAEQEGFLKAIDEKQISRRDFLTLSRSFIRFFRVGAYPPLRGTFISLDDDRSLLYTKGSVEFFKVYPGLYVPKTLLLYAQGTDQTAKQLASEILALTKLNWNNTQFDSFFPITLTAARQVTDILRHLEGEPPELTKYAYYM
jgi:hypothetical protein